MSTPLGLLPISVVIDYNLRTFNVSVLDITVVRPSLAHAMDELLLKLFKHHSEIQDIPDDQLSIAGQDFKASSLDFGHQLHTIP